MEIFCPQCGEGSLSLPCPGDVEQECLACGARVPLPAPILEQRARPPVPAILQMGPPAPCPPRRVSPGLSRFTGRVLGASLAVVFLLGLWAFQVGMGLCGLAPVALVVLPTIVAVGTVWVTRLDAHLRARRATGPPGRWGRALARFERWAGPVCGAGWT